MLQVRTFNTKPFWFLPVIVIAFVTAMAALIQPLHIPPHQATLFWIGAVMIALPSAIFSIVLPHLKVGFMASAWRLPSQTFICPRTLLRLIGSALIGNFLGQLAIAVFVEGTQFGLPSILFPTVAAFAYSATKRLQRHPHSEFAMPLSLLFGKSRRR